MDDKDSTPPEEPVTAEVPITPPAAPSHDLESDEPTFSAKQVRYLLKNLGPGGHAAYLPQEQTPQVRRARGKYDRKFGWMHLVDAGVGAKAVVAVAFIALGVNYLISPNFRSAEGLSGIASLNAPLLFIASALVFANILVKWRRSHLYTTQKEVIFEVKPFWPLLVLKKVQKAKIQKLDTSQYTQNVVEDAFSMNSGTLTLDTPAQANDLHQVKGVKDVALLEQDIS